MIEHQLMLRATHRPEVLERILRVIRHRGFTVTKMEMMLEKAEVQLNLSVTSTREISLLINQLAKLPDVVSLVNVE